MKHRKKTREMKEAPKGKSKYARKGTENYNKKWITLPVTQHRIRVDRGYQE